MPIRPAPPARHRSFPPVAGPETRLLLLGSLPGVASLAAARYYAHPQNQFWRLIGGVIGRDLASLDYAVRLDALVAARVGVWDMVAEAAREGSLDSAIRDTDTNDLAGLTARLPALVALGFNGGTAAALFRRHYPTLAERYATVALPSSSPAYTLPFADKLARWMALRPFLPAKDGTNVSKSSSKAA